MNFIISANYLSIGINHYRTIYDFIASEDTATDPNETQTLVRLQTAEEDTIG